MHLYHESMVIFGSEMVTREWYPATLRDAQLEAITAKLLPGSNFEQVLSNQVCKLAHDGSLAYEWTAESCYLEANLSSEGDELL